jgi:hypothetical protein
VCCSAGEGGQRALDLEAAEAECGPALRLIWPGESFGELALLQRSVQRTCSVIAGVAPLPDGASSMSGSAAAARRTPVAISAVGVMPDVHAAVPDGVSAGGVTNTGAVHAAREGAVADGVQHEATSARNTVDELAAALPPPHTSCNQGGPARAAHSDTAPALNLIAASSNSADPDRFMASVRALAAGGAGAIGAAHMSGEGAHLIRVSRELFDSAVTSLQAAQLEQRLAFLCKFPVRFDVAACTMLIGQPWHASVPAQ